MFNQNRFMRWMKLKMVVACQLPISKDFVGQILSGGCQQTSQSKLEDTTRSLSSHGTLWVVIFQWRVVSEPEPHLFAISPGGGGGTYLHDIEVGSVLVGYICCRWERPRGPPIKANVMARSCLLVVTNYHHTNTFGALALKSQSTFCYRRARPHAR